MCPLDYTAVAGSGKVGPVNQVNTSWVAIVTPTDRPKSVRNRSVIEFFVALFVLSFCPLDISVGVGAFVIGLSQMPSFFSYHKHSLLHLNQDNSIITCIILMCLFSFFIQRLKRSCNKKTSLEKLH